MRLLAAGLFVAAGVLTAGAGPAFANTSTVGPLAGGGGGTVNAQSASSSCPTGAIVTGLQVGQESRGYIGSVAVICRAPDGTVTVGSAIGDTGYYQSTASCSGTDVGLGIYGYTGDIVDGVGIRCGQLAGTASNGPLVYSDNGGGLNGPYDCPAGSALTGLTGTYASYYGGDVVVSLTGVCTAFVPTSFAQCKEGGWMSYGTLFKNQGDCVSYVATKGKNAPSGSGA